MAKKSKTRRNPKSGIIQVSVWLNEQDIESLREIGKRPEVDREWSWLARKAIREFIERDQRSQTLNVELPQ
jgi:hypothetical protein